MMVTTDSHSKKGQGIKHYRALGRRGKLWQAAYYDHAVREEEDLRNLARYIVLNPVRAGLIQRIYDYPFWNAVWI